ncbi:T9SS type A sorting domain-containing protein [Chryseobacterium rhizosphaerae]|uniref:T9SS type A sorting domain-containing protein n=1 Tax=Chryseobacterium rhizosphaerae TaxID=395937 RepID=UPI0023583A29|nr:T9SS type A sorting domain-containing protein [Chryseobacterium rhizosphaerae]MDC8101010.1 T9SS type A sorting domain-containing protein [Chryseobacterium rhizosphaerae]
MKKAFLFFFLACLMVGSSLKAQTDYIICLDNGSTINNARFQEMKLTAAKLIERIMACHPKNRYAVVHYGTGLNNGPSLGLTPRIYIESDFTTLTFPEPYLNRRLSYGQHFNEALGLIGNALDGSYSPEIVSPQTSLHKNGSSKLAVLVLTNGSRNTGDLLTGSYLANYYDTALNTPGAFKNVTDFKVNRGAKFVMMHMSPNAQSSATGASIASAGGSYSGGVETNVNDPDYGVLPRLYYPRPQSFVFESVSEMPKVDEIINSTCNTGVWGSLKFYYEYNSCGVSPDFNIYGDYTLPPGATVTHSKMVVRDISTGVDYGISTTPTFINGNQVYFHFYPSDINFPPGSTAKYKFIMTVQYSFSSGTMDVMSWNHYPMFPYDLDLGVSCTRGVPEAADSSIKITPNPTDGKFKGVLNREIGSGKLEVLDLNGNVLLTKTVEGKAFDADLKNRQQGVYVIKVTSDKGEINVGRIIKK